MFFCKRRKEEKFEDRRVFERRKAEVSLRYGDKEAVTFDISAQGLGIITASALRPETPLDIRLRFPGSQEEFLTSGKVAWCCRFPGKLFRFGVCLEKPELMMVSQFLAAVHQ